MVNTSILISVLINAVLSADSLSRRATCVPTSAGNAGTDDVPAITAAIKSCGGGGIIQIPSGKTYMIRSVLDFAGCVNCDFQVEGTIKVSDDTTFWNGKTAIISISAISGAQLRSLTGSGLLDGNGQAAWDLFATDSTFKRPTFVLITKASKNIAVSNLKVKNPPNVFFSNNADSANIAYSSLTLTAVSSSSNLPKNTDGFDVGPATYTTFKNISVSNNDDCIAFKRGANYVTVDGITCKGSHGLSVGSVGGSQGVTDTVQNIYVTNAVMGTSTKAVGIKLYPGGSFYGSAIVRNITFDGVTVSSSDYAAQIQSCYNAANAASCAANPSTAQLTDIYFKNFKGTTSTKYGTTIANINCPAAGTCNVYFSGWTVVPPSGTAKYLCANIDSTPGVTCSTGASG
ncbi:glycoside hydrolase family 28 protein [Amniculicola lignicola CBS 123094]|uniref:Glycoside hydrolase family 28 protein n=1 Tax=Amniculicola lignicola CBS 123094 TaxID=1392246 RepID=A0A6A5WLK2_9PLEO|nr:glycoside hydrolase family 28 protein [Amniculicola lignicola CBS 123094]